MKLKQIYTNAPRALTMADSAMAIENISRFQEILLNIKVSLLRVFFLVYRYTEEGLLKHME